MGNRSHLLKQISRQLVTDNFTKIENKTTTAQKTFFEIQKISLSLQPQI